MAPPPTFGFYLIRCEMTVDRRTAEIVLRWTEMEVSADEDGDGIATKRRGRKKTLRFNTMLSATDFMVNHFVNVTGDPEPA